VYIPSSIPNIRCNGSPLSMDRSSFWLAALPHTLRPTWTTTFPADTTVFTPGDRATSRSLVMSVEPLAHSPGRPSLGPAFFGHAADPAAVNVRFATSDLSLWLQIDDWVYRVGPSVFEGSPDETVCVDAAVVANDGSSHTPACLCWYPSPELLLRLYLEPSVTDKSLCMDDSDVHILTRLRTIILRAAASIQTSPTTTSTTDSPSDPHGKSLTNSGTDVNAGVAPTPHRPDRVRPRPSELGYDHTLAELQSYLLHPVPFHGEPAVHEARVGNLLTTLAEQVAAKNAPSAVGEADPTNDEWDKILRAYFPSRRGGPANNTLVELPTMEATRDRLRLWQARYNS
jgi:hypothetical protein